ncbi:hypothetical protein RM704_10700 [Streptomyces sp. DSM 3412]|uniref:Uncharacterized protein n=1 Tax=Streptomyces gottesmaniae TaxID=3075518 RepID=A0ABU2YV78_9ACTN|nr:hypothetical protein [Streptomyces sp. DSM 3412]MDT0567934.1 hypothetical protein [Streptomyces sp. DSM 3412]
MSTEAPTSTDPDLMSAECAVGQRPEHKALHGMCRQTKDILLPYSKGVLLQSRCRCACHPWSRPRKVRKP